MYFQLNAENLVSFLASLPEMQSHFSSFQNLGVTEITDGNMNYAFVVSNLDNPEESVFCKQSPPYIKVLGEEWPLTRQRMTAEIEALSFQAKVSPSTAPKIYYQSEVLSILILENLQGYNILRDELIKGHYFANFAEHMASYLAATLFFSSDFGQSAAQKKALIAKSENSDMCMISEDFIFTYPFEHHAMNDYNPALSQGSIDMIQRDSEVRAQVAQMKYLFTTSKQALLHGDLHTGSIMLNQERTYVIDAEFAFAGPIGFDVGALVANLYLNYFSHVGQGNAESEKYSEWLLQQVEALWDGFETKFTQYWCEYDEFADKPFMGNDLTGDSHGKFRTLFLQEVFRDTLGFAACKIIRRILGIAKVADFMQFEDEIFRAKLETQALTFAKMLLLNRGSIKSFIDVNKAIHH
ncbi:MAG: S-methyl-5-thioribose kinase [Paraglaciecola sp.]|uniref:S-methyl-5-thioribose kinase n=1 Tax=Paraglaciecola sp. TaxID=1920173 RepID=UPI003299185F